MGSNLSIMALESFQPEVATNKRVDQLSLVKNEVDANLKLNLIKYGEGEANGVVSVPTEDDWYIKKIVVAYMNFNQGVTELEANNNLSTLTGARDDNWVILSLYDYRPLTAKKEQNISLNQSNKTLNAFSNKSDLFYYAVEFGMITENGQWGETWWSRGKIDYRDCVHSAIFQEEAMNCKRSENNGVVKYVPQVKQTNEILTLPDNEQIITWEDEWKDVILANYEAVQDESELMQNYLNNGLDVLDQNEKNLDGIVKSLAHYSVADPKLVWLSQGITFWKIKIDEMKKFYEKTNVTEVETLKKEIEVLKMQNMALQQENETLVVEVAGSRQEKDALAMENVELKRQNSEQEAENTALKQEKMDLEEKVSELESEKKVLEVAKSELEQVNYDLNLRNSDLQTKGEQLESENKNLREELERNENEQKKNSHDNYSIVGVVGDTGLGVMEDKKEGEGMNDGGDSRAEEQGVEIPILGEEELKISGGWWFLISVIGLIGMVIVIVKRRFSKE